MVEPHPAFTLVLALAAGILAQSLARHARVPGIVLLLLVGAGLGPDGLGWVAPRSLGAGLVATVELAVAVILFEGGLNLEITRLRRQQAAIRRLVTWGALITLGGAAAAVHLVFDSPLMRSLLFGSLVVVTGPTVVGPLVRDLRLRPRVATVLEAEGVFIDPVGVILAVLLLQVTLAPGADSLREGATRLLLQLGFGAGAGAAGGLALSQLLRIRRVVPEGFENIFVLASVLLLFQGCNELVSESGILAVTVAGVVVGNLRTRVDRDLREFKDQMSVMLIGLLFVLLAADVRIAEVQELGLGGLAVVGLLVFAVRPLGVFVCTAGSELSLRERAFVAWVAPRGIVAAAVASVTANALFEAGDPEAMSLRALVFLTIALTVVLAGSTAGLVGRLLGVRLPRRETVAILGAQGLGLLLAEWLRALGRPVVFLDSNPQNCRRAEEAGFSVVFGDALHERTQQRARFESVDAVVGLTPNQVLNSVFVSRAREQFRVPEGFIAVARPEKGLAPDLVEKEEARVLFEGPHDVERWDVRTRHGDVSLDTWEMVSPPDEATTADGATSHVLLGVLRNGRAAPMHPGIAFSPGDRVGVAICEPERADAEQRLRARGFERPDEDREQSEG